jgi:N-acetylglucosamine-6-phosphate deacetylase
MSTSVRIRSARLYDAPDDGLVDIELRGGIIASIVPAAERTAAGEAADDDVAHVIDAGGRTVIPGLIDLHVHGAGGGDLMDGTAESLATMSTTLARLGTTAFLATGFMRPGGDDAHLRNAARLVVRTPGASLLGLHLEGPFVNRARIGGLPPESVWPISDAAVEELLEAGAGALRMVTIAPELDGGSAAVRRLAAAGVIPSMGHTDATYHQARAGIEAGVSHVTHLYNAMAPFHHRAPGPLPAIHEAEHVTVQLVSDDVHVGRDVVRWTHRIFGARRCVCVTDGIRTTGLPDGRHVLGGLEYDSRDGVARYADGRLIGTSLPLLEIVLRFRDFTGCSLAEAVDTGSANPARVLGLEHRKGRIAPGYDADLVVLEGDPFADGGERPKAYAVYTGDRPPIRVMTRSGGSLSQSGMPSEGLS